jgi:uncharacterized RDD family membrane protein YckC
MRTGTGHHDRMSSHSPGVPASLRRRLSAFVLDSALAYLAIAATQALLYVVNPARSNATPTVLHVWVFSTVTLPLCVYLAWCDRRPRGASPAAAWLGLRVVSRSADPLSWSRALGRNAIKLLPFELNHIALFYSQTTSLGSAVAIGCGILLWVVILATWWSAWRDAEGRTVHDRLANTVVLQFQRVVPSAPHA